MEVQDQRQQIMELVEVVGLVLLDQMVVQQQAAMVALEPHQVLVAAASLTLAAAVDQFMRHLQQLELEEPAAVETQVPLLQEQQELQILAAAVVVAQETLT